MVLKTSPDMSTQPNVTQACEQLKFLPDFKGTRGSHEILHSHMYQLSFCLWGHPALMKFKTCFRLITHSHVDACNFHIGWCKFYIAPMISANLHTSPYKISCTHACLRGVFEGVLLLSWFFCIFKSIYTHLKSKYKIGTKTKKNWNNWQCPKSCKVGYTIVYFACVTPRFDS